MPFASLLSLHKYCGPQSQPYGVRARAYFVSLRASFKVHKTDCFSFISSALSLAACACVFESAFILFLLYLFILFLSLFSQRLSLRRSFISILPFCHTFAWDSVEAVVALSQCILNVSKRLAKRADYIFFAEKPWSFHVLFRTTIRVDGWFWNKRRFKIKFVAHCYLKRQFGAPFCVLVIYFISGFCKRFREMNVSEYARIIHEITWLFAISKTITEWMRSGLAVLCYGPRNDAHVRISVWVSVEASELSAASISTFVSKRKNAFFLVYFQNISTVSGQIKYFVNFVDGVENLKVWIGNEITRTFHGQKIKVNRNIIAIVN